MYMYFMRMKNRELINGLSTWRSTRREEIKFTEIPCALPPRRASGRGGWSCTFEDRYNDIRYVAKPQVPHLILSSPLTKSETNSTTSSRKSLTNLS